MRQGPSWLPMGAATWPWFTASSSGKAIFCEHRAPGWWPSGSEVAGIFFLKKMMSARNNRDKNRLNHVKVRDSFGEIPVEFVVMLEFLQAGKLVNIFVYTHIIHIHSSVKNPLVLECRKKQPCFHHEVVPWILNMSGGVVEGPFLVKRGGFYYLYLACTIRPT